MPTGCPSLLGIQKPTLMMVSKLIDVDKKVWHKKMVAEMFQANEASKVLAIPLNKQPVLDKMIWSDSVIGQFLVKSAYFKARKALGKTKNSYANKSTIWKIIWSASVTPSTRKSNT